MYKQKDRPRHIHDIITRTNKIIEFYPPFVSLLFYYMFPPSMSSMAVLPLTAG